MIDNTNMYENLQNFIEERLNDSYTNIAQTKEYKETSMKNIALIEIIRDKTKNNQLVEEYTKTLYDMYQLQLQQAYLTGFKDSNIILNKTIILE